MTTKNPSISLPVSPESIRSLEQYAEALKKAKMDVKSLSDLLKGLKLQEINNPANGGLAAFTRGTNFKNSLAVNEAKMLNSEMGQAMAYLNQFNKLANQGNKLFKSTSAAQMAFNGNLLTGIRTVRKMTDIKKVEARLEAQKLRLGYDMQAQDQKSVQRGAALIRSLERQLEILKEQERVKARQDKIAAMPTQKELADRQRSMSMERIFGDGGASLFAIQAGVMANYAAMNAARTGVSEALTFSTQLDDALRNLQAITVTTDTNLEQLKTSLIDISEATKFTAVEVAEAAVVLGQAGMSIREIEDALPAVSLLATATGTDLAKAVDIATSAIGVFKLESSQMGSVANTMTAAVNQSKLNIEKLTLGLQYSGNIAAQSGIRFEELTAAMGAMSNAGIRSGSTLGTGLRQVLIQLQKPSEGFRDRLKELGLSMVDVDVKSHGLYGVLKNLQEAGFTAADAVASFPVRAAAAFNALDNNIDQVLELEESFNNSTAASKANETQMRSLTNQAKRFGSIFKSVVEVAIEPFIYLTRDALKASGDFLEKLRENENVLRILGAAVVSVGGSLAVLFPLKLIKNLVLMLGGFKAVNGVMTTVGAVAAPKATKGIMALGGSVASMLKPLRFVGVAFKALSGPLGAITLAVGLGITAFKAFGKEQDLLGRKLDQAKTDFDNAQGAVEATASEITHLDNEISSLKNRYKTLSTDSRQLRASQERIKSQFADMGVEIDKVDTGLDEMLGALEELRDELSEEYVIKIRRAQDKLETQQETQQGVTKDVRQTLSGATTRFGTRLAQNNLVIPDQMLELIGELQNVTDPARVSAALAKLEDLPILDLKVNKESLDYIEDLGGTRNTPTLEAFNRATAEFISELGKIGPELKDSLSAQARNDQAQRKLKRTEEQALYNQDPLVQSVGATLNTLNGAEATMIDGFSDPSSTIDSRYAEAKRFQEHVEATIARRREQLMERIDLDAEFVQKTIREMENAQAEILGGLEPYFTEFQAQEQALLKEQAKRIQMELKAVEQELKDKTDRTELSDALQRYSELKQALYENQLEEIEADGDLTQKVKEQQADLLLEKLMQELESAFGVFEELDSRDKQALLERTQLAIEAEIRRLEKHISNSTGTNDAMYQRLKEMLRRRNALQVQQLESQTGRTDEENATALENLRIQLDQDLEGVAVKQLEELLTAQKEAKAKEESRRAQMQRDTAARLNSEMSDIQNQLGAASDRDDINTLVQEATDKRNEILALELQNLWGEKDRSLSSKRENAKLLRKRAQEAIAGYNSRLEEFSKGEEAFAIQAEISTLQGEQSAIQKAKADAATTTLVEDLDAAERAVIDQIARLRAALQSLENPDRTEGQTSLAGIQEEQWRMSQMEGVDGSTQSQLDDINAQRSQEIQNQIQLLRDSMARTQSEYDRKDAELERELQSADMTRAAELTAKRKELHSRLSDAIQRVLAQILALTESENTRNNIEEELATAVATLDNMVLAIEEANADRVSALKAIAENEAAEEEAKQRESIVEQTKAAEAALDAAIRLAKKAQTEEAKANALEEALKQAERIMQLGLKEASMDFGDNGEDNVSAYTARLEQLRTELGNTKGKIAEISAAPIKTGGGGGGGGGASKKAEDKIQKWIEAATAQTNMLALGAAESLYEPEAAVDAIEQTVDDALDKLKEVEAQISALQSRAMNGNLTAKEQERLNTLVAQHGQLTQFVANEQARLVQLKYQEGDLMGGLKLQVQSFAQDNLDLFKTLEGGISSLLGSLSGALATFFTSWSSGTKKGKEAFAELAVGVIKSIQNIFAQMLAVYALQRILGWIFPGQGIPQQSFGQIAAGAVSGLKEGGKVKYAAAGTRVEGNLNRDSQDYKLMPGEYVLRRSAAQAIGYDTLDGLNAMGNRTFQSSDHQGAAKPQSREPQNNNMNLYLVDERSKAPSLGPQDVIAVVTDDISRGGSTKKLIKSVSMGQF